MNGTIYAGDYKVMFGEANATAFQITIIDTIDGRFERKEFADEASMARVMRDFMNPEEPGEEFRKAFPFWC